ncbi:MAG: hypothetical protein P8N94_15605 [Gammaproteobacteria bacterium]|nr:hypothetical protein [Gammaproteobacteria bacterium]
MIFFISALEDYLLQIVEPFTNRDQSFFDSYETGLGRLVSFDPVLDRRDSMLEARGPVKNPSGLEG